MLYSSLQHASEVSPCRTAVAMGKNYCTYRELWERSSLLAKLLTGAGIKPGDRVVILGANSIETVIAWWAVLKCHAICVFLSETLKPSAIDFITRDVKPSQYLCCSSISTTLLPKSIKLIYLDHIDWTESVGMQHHNSLPNNTDLIASIVYTSGSTGQPKGVCLSHKNLLSSGEISARGHEISSEDNYLMLVPLHYVHGQMMLISLTLCNAKLSIMPSFVFLTAVTKKINEQQITGLSGVPYHFLALVGRGNFLSTDLPSLKWIGITGGAMKPNKLLEIAESKPEIKIHIGYGQTECSPRITRLDPAKISTKPTSVGSVEPGLTVDFINAAGELVAEGETGELVVSGPSVMHGYWNDPINTKSVIDPQGRLHTGDLAYRDSEGDIYIRGRCQAMIKSAGERIFPEELEAILLGHSDVAEIAVVGEPDDMYGQIVIAHVILTESNSNNVEEALSRIEGYCLDHVSFARAPRQYQRWTEFPRKENGKVDKQQLTTYLPKKVLP